MTTLNKTKVNKVSFLNSKKTQWGNFRRYSL